MKYLITFAVLAVVAIHSPLLGVGAAAIVTLMYLFSLRVRPMRPCRLCAGSGANRSRWFWKYAFGNCLCCHGSKSHVRLGVRVLQRGRYKELTSR